MSEPLGIHTKNVSALREKKYSLQSMAARLLPQERVSWCSRQSRAPVIEIRRNGEKCFFHGLAKCGSAWLCPVCSARISENRRAELQKAASSEGYSLLLVTLTLQHSRGEKLESLLASLNTAWRKTRAGRAWQRIEQKYGLVASVSSLEITFSQENGFHPHKHVLFFSTLPENELQVAEFERELSARWRNVLSKSGNYGSEYYAVNVLLGEKPVAGYIAKWGVVEEVAKSQAKEGNAMHYSMWQVLELAGSGEKWAQAAFCEYAHAVKNKRQLFWSSGARELFGLGKEQSEQEIAESEPEESELVCSLTRQEWRLVCEHELRGEVLAVAEREGSPGVARILERLKR